MFAMLLAGYGMSLAVSEPSIAGEGQPPETHRSWTGFYVGGFAGYKHAEVNPSLTLEGSWIPSDAIVVEARAGEDLTDDGAELGGLIGYNHQWSDWVLGLEASAGYLWLRDSEQSEDIRPPSTNQFFVSRSFKTHYLVTAGPRVGYAFCDWLPYATAGLAIGDLDFSQDLAAFDYFTTPTGGSKSQTRVGWFVGGGLQYALSDHWSMRAQYEYIDLGHVQFHTDFRSDYPVRNEAKLKEQNASLAIIYAF